MLQGNLFPPDTAWAPPGVFPELVGLVGFDLETRDPRLKTYGPGWAFDGQGDAYVVGVSIFIEATGFSGYFPVRHEGGGNLPEEVVKKWLLAQLKRWRETGLELVVANASYDPGWVWRWLGYWHDGPWHDVQIAAPLLDEHRTSYSLDALAQDYLNQCKDQALLREATRAFGLKDPGADMWRLPAPYVGPYAEQDARLAVQLWRAMLPRLREEQLDEALALEESLVPVLFQMRRRGVRVDVGYAELFRQELLIKERDALAELKRTSGVQVDPWVAQSCATALAKDGITCPATEKTGQPSVTQDLLDAAVSQGSASAALILKARKASTIRGTFIEGHVLGHQVKGRIHAEFHSLRGEFGGASTHRFSSSNPNLQNIPSMEKDPEVGGQVRKMFLPEEGQLWGAPDYSSQEPRLTVHFACLVDMPKAYEIAHQYRDNPRTDYHQVVADLAMISRKSAKVINLGLAYGMGEAKLCHSLGLPTEVNERGYEVAGEQGRRLLKQYHAHVPYVKPLMDLCKNRAERKGFLRLLGGYRKRFPLKDGERWYTHKALNALIQGSAAIQTKKAMVAVAAAGHTMLVTVHDELGCSVADRAEADEIGRLMSTVIELKVPTVCDVALGPNWGEAK